MKRTFWKTDRPVPKDSASAPKREIGYHEVRDEAEATLIGSTTGRVVFDGPTHAPVIDIDLPCKLIESSTPGHFHLYIDKEMTWEQYKGLLLAMADAGVVERGYYDASVARGQSFVRKPGLKK